MPRSLTAIAATLDQQLAPLRFAAPITHVYRPLQYAWKPASLYLRRYGKASKRIVLVGMNPGPFGMAQTGVPFGDVAMVRDWLGIRAAVAPPDQENPRRPVTGFACPRREISGERLWGWAKSRFGTADAFFADHFVWNYCPLAFMEASGRNFTPDRLSAKARAAVFAACDAALREVVVQLKARAVIGIGGFAMARAQQAVAGLPVVCSQMMHPSPANPAANRGWAPLASATLDAVTRSLERREAHHAKRPARGRTASAAQKARMGS